MHASHPYKVLLALSFLLPDRVSNPNTKGRWYFVSLVNGAACKSTSASVQAKTCQHLGVVRFFSISKPSSIVQDASSSCPIVVYPARVYGFESSSCFEQRIQLLPTMPEACAITSSVLESTLPSIESLVLVVPTGT
ncbi:hypothetical protein BKA81DRAFT_193908 [Phyllosticta paracitricarpa]